MKITKRNGNVVVYDDEKIVRSIMKANAGAGERGLTKAAAEDIAADVFRKLTAESDIIATKDVRECVYDLLQKRGFPKTAKCYAEYKKI